MDLIFAFSLLIAIAYAAMILSFVWGFLRLNAIRKTVLTKNEKLSVVVPARNEDKHIVPLLEDLFRQDYPQENFEIILVDDHSVDGTFLQAASFLEKHPNLNIISLDGTGREGKKAALEAGIKQSRHDLIVTTDTDCRMGTGWLSGIAACIEKDNPILLLGPVLFPEGKSFWHKVLCLEQLSLVFITAGSCGLKRPVMSSGANMAFRKNLFTDKADPYKKNIPSGDDMFLLSEARRISRKKISFFRAEEGIVITSPPVSLSSFLDQRKRWVSKSRHYRDPEILVTAAMVFLVSVSLTGLLICSIFLPACFKSFLIIFSIKSIVDYLALYLTASAYEKKGWLWFFFPAQGIYFLYVSLTSIWGLFGSFGWKGRRYMPGSVKT